MIAENGAPMTIGLSAYIQTVYGTRHYKRLEIRAQYLH